MRDKAFFIECGECGTIFTMPMDVDPADRSVGIMGPTICFPEEIQCPKCKRNFTGKEIEEAEKIAYRQLENEHPNMWW